MPSAWRRGTSRCSSGWAVSKAFLRAVSDLGALQVLVDLLAERSGSVLSVNSLREDVGAAYATVRAWLLALEALYHCFLVRPYARSVKRGLRVQPKIYLFDVLAIPSESQAARRETLAALHLLKAYHFWTDTAAGAFELRYVRDKEKREVDLLVLRDRTPWLLVECKSSETEPSPHLAHFAAILNPRLALQLVDRPGYDRTYPARGVRVLDYERFLAAFP